MGNLRLGSPAALLRNPGPAVCSQEEGSSSFEINCTEITSGGGSDSEDSTSSLQVEPHSGTWLQLLWTMGSNYGEWWSVGAT